MIKKLEKLQKDLAWWQDKLNRSRKESLRSIRAVHVQHLQSEIAKLTQEIEKRDLEMLSNMPRK
jgi:cob(I)alamin adenosyltransferase